MVYLVLMAVGSWVIAGSPPQAPRPGVERRPEPIPAFCRLLEGRVLLASVKKGMTPEQVHQFLGDPLMSKATYGILREFYRDLGVIVVYAYHKTLDERRYEFRVTNSRWLDCGRDNPFFWLVQ